MSFDTIVIPMDAEVRKKENDSERAKADATRSNFQQAATIRRLQATIRRRDREIHNLKEAFRKERLRALDAELQLCVK